MQILETSRSKAVLSPDYNYAFNKKNGYFLRWGTLPKDDPEYSPFGPEILDLEISAGRCKGGCKFCYKQNGPDKTEINMTFEQFKIIFKKMPKVLTQIAFGLCDMHSNPDFFKMARYARKHGVIPNFTTSGQDVTPVVAALAGKLCGAVSVSIVNKEKSYDAIKLFTDEIGKKGNTLHAVNIHLVYHQDNEDFIYDVLRDSMTDVRLQKLNAIVLLALKNKGRALSGFKPLSYAKFSNIIDFAMLNKIDIGFDSCSACKYEKWVNKNPMPEDQKKHMLELAEPCESGLFSFYINVYGDGFPCSFMEEALGWEQGISVINCKNFNNDVWNHPRLLIWKEKLIKNNRNCPLYTI